MDLGRPRSVHGSLILAFGWIRQNTPVGLHVAESTPILPAPSQPCSVLEQIGQGRREIVIPDEPAETGGDSAQGNAAEQCAFIGECLEKRRRKAPPHGRIYQNPALREQRVQLLGFELIDESEYF
jgi:hypothetical protein